MQFRLRSITGYLLGGLAAWLLLTPLSVAAEVVTFPFQLLAVFVIDC